VRGARELRASGASMGAPSRWRLPSEWDGRGAKRVACVAVGNGVRAWASGRGRPSTSTTAKKSGHGWLH
jgi:hypothetical protein